MSDYRIVDIQPGGKEISFGEPADDNLSTMVEGLDYSETGMFKCAIGTFFKKALRTLGDVIAGGSLKASGNVDVSGALYGHTHVTRCVNVNSQLTNGTTQKSDMCFLVQDINGKTHGYITAYKLANGRSRMAFYAQRNINGTDYYNGLNFDIADDGTRSIAVSEAAPWRTMLGIGEYVTSYGSSGNWRWRKWNTNRFDAWYSASASASITSTSGSLYYSASQSLSIPSGIGATSVVYASVEVVTGEATWAKLTGISTSAISYTLLSSLSRSSASRTIKAYVHGSYK